MLGPPRIQNDSKILLLSLYRHLDLPKIDSGKIILQKKVKILKKDNTESLSKKILIEEHKVYPRALQMVAKTLLTRQQ